MFTILDYEDVVNILLKTKSGTMSRIGYRTNVPLKKEFEKQGYRVIKLVEATVRFGVNYAHIADVAPTLKPSDYVDTRDKHTTWIIRHKLQHNSNTNKTYVTCATVNKNNNVKFEYRIVTPEGELIKTDDKYNQLLNRLVIPSYFTKKHEPEYLTINVDNITRINNVGQKLFS